MYPAYMESWSLQVAADGEKTEKVKKKKALSCMPTSFFLKPFHQEKNVICLWNLLE